MWPRGSIERGSPPSLHTICQRSAKTLGISWAVIGLLVTVGFPFCFIWSDCVLFSSYWCTGIPPRPTGKLKPCFDVLRSILSLSFWGPALPDPWSTLMTCSHSWLFLWAERQNYMYSQRHDMGPCLHSCPGIMDLQYMEIVIAGRENLDTFLSMMQIPPGLQNRADFSDNRNSTNPVSNSIKRKSWAKVDEKRLRNSL